MLTKLIFTLSVIFFLSGCASYHSNCDSKPVYLPVPFWNNPRICFRDISCDSPVQTMRSRKCGRTTFNQDASHGMGVSIREAYGCSLNDAFNGSAPPKVVLTTPKRLCAPTPLPCPCKVDSIAPVHTENVVQTPLPQGTTYVPLTFPIPPPDAMVKQFHMKVG